MPNIQNNDEWIDFHSALPFTRFVDDKVVIQSGINKPSDICQMRMLLRAVGHSITKIQRETHRDGRIVFNLLYTDIPVSKFFETENLFKGWVMERLADEVVSQPCQSIPTRERAIEMDDDDDDPQ